MAPPPAAAAAVTARLMSQQLLCACTPGSVAMPPGRLAQVFSEDEDLARDTTEVQLAAGRDPQGIPWELTQFTRDGYRVRRCSCRL